MLVLNGCFDDADNTVFGFDVFVAAEEEAFSPCFEASNCFLFHLGITPLVGHEEFASVQEVFIRFSNSTTALVILLD